MMDVVSLALAFIAGFLVAFLILWRREAKLRKEIAARLRAAFKGKASEVVAPYLEGFPCKPSEAKFIGDPIDFVAFVGDEEVKKILFIEVKSGSSSLSKRQKSVKKAVEEGKIEFVEVHIRQ